MSGDYVDPSALVAPMEVHVTVPRDLIFKLPPGANHVEIGRLENDRRIWDQSFSIYDPATGKREELDYEGFKRRCDEWLVAMYVGDRIHGVEARHIQELADLHGDNVLYMSDGAVQEVLAASRVQYGVIMTSDELTDRLTDADYDDDGLIRMESAQRIADELNGKRPQ
ncbi:hypothetical protein [Streptomyces sp. NPDC057002]|uniref:hypothetical protein n=1 Tax=Streptomyces sp. NPDC057002 TaxID=3345992 RepID=UPI00363983B5